MVLFSTKNVHVTDCVEFANCLCRFQMAKLDALGLKPVLFYAIPGKKCVVDTVTNLSVTAEMKNILDKMQKTYEFLLKCKKNFFFFRYFLYDSFFSPLYMLRRKLNMFVLTIHSNFESTGESE